MFTWEPLKNSCDSLSPPSIFLLWFYFVLSYLSHGMFKAAFAAQVTLGEEIALDVST